MIELNPLYQGCRLHGVQIDGPFKIKVLDDTSPQKDTDAASKKESQCLAYSFSFQQLCELVLRQYGDA